MWNSHLKASGIDTVVKAYYVIPREKKTPKHMKISDLHISPKLLFSWLTVLAYLLCTETKRVVFTAHDHKRAAQKLLEWGKSVGRVYKTRVNHSFVRQWFTQIHCVELKLIFGHACKSVHLCNNLHRPFQKHGFTNHWVWKCSSLYIRCRNLHVKWLMDNSAHVSWMRPNVWRHGMTKIIKALQNPAL